MVCHHLDKRVPEDVAFADSRIRPEISVDPERYEVRVDGELITCEPAKACHSHSGILCSNKLYYHTTQLKELGCVFYKAKSIKPHKNTPHFSKVRCVFCSFLGIQNILDFLNA
ncbi:hypothetical protein A4G18_05180 [Pasteurellaceae bacterium Pebbles2]|nr:hypothetical protein [Pasteurellaceae bacterium Pebbles2]